MSQRIIACMLGACIALAACRSEPPESRIVTSDEGIHAPVTVTGIPKSRAENMRDELARLRAAGARDQAEALALAIELDTCRVLDGDALARCAAPIEARATRFAASPGLDAETRTHVQHLIALARNAQNLEVLR